MWLRAGDQGHAMTNPFSLSTVALVVLIGTLAGLSTGYMVGHEQGIASERAKNDADQVQKLSGLVASFETLIAASNATSQAMRAALTARQTQDDRSTKEFKDALAKTADKRTDCRFDDDVMQQFSIARQRAAASAASGILGAVPDRPAGTGR